MPKIVADKDVFEAILKTISSHGYGGSTTKMIAEAADVNEATLFRKYGSKDQMVLKAMEYLVSKVDVENFAYYTGDIRADLTRLMKTFFEVEKMNGRLFMMLASEVQLYPELKQMSHLPISTLMRIGQLFARYQAEGILRQEHPFQAVLAFMAPVVVAHRMRDAGVTGSMLDIDRETHIDSYLNGRVADASTL